MARRYSTSQNRTGWVREDPLPPRSMKHCAFVLPLGGIILIVDMGTSRKTSARRQITANKTPIYRAHFLFLPRVSRKSCLVGTGPMDVLDF